MLEPVQHPGFNLEQISGRTIVAVRVRPDAVETAIYAIRLPRELCWSGEDPIAHWCGPDQWLLTSDTKAAKDIIQSIHINMPDQLHAATDMSSAYVCFALSGPAARTILAMGCGIDMHAGAFMTGYCARTHFANVQLLIVAIDDNSFNLYVDRSHARYLNDWLVSAGDDPITRLDQQTSSEYGEPI